MRKLLTATTALALVGGAAFAELSMSGDAELGIDYNSEPGEGNSKHSFVHEVGIDFSGSGTTDGGLSFGGSAGFDTGDDVVNTGTVFISGAFGKVTIGDNDAADLTAGGIADVGLNGIGVDDVVEDHRGGTAAALRYDHSFGQIAIAISAGTKPGSAEVEAFAGRYAYSISGTDGVATVYLGLPKTLAVMEPIYLNAGAIVIGRPTGKVEVTPEDGSKVDIFGYKRNDDGDVVNGAGDEVTDKNILAAFTQYEALYDLGEDKVVGADDQPSESGALSVLTVLEPAVKAAEAVPADNQYAFGMSFEASGVTVGVGYDSEKTVSMGLGFSTGDISSNLLYVRTDDDKTGMGGDLSYTMGASTLTLAYAQSKPDAGETTDAMGINVSHDLGGGASMVAGFGDVDDVSKASVGLSFSF